MQLARRSTRRPRLRGVVLAAGLTGLGLGIAGCGGGPKAPSVASLGTTTSATSTVGQSSSPAASDVAYANCMTSHGVPTSRPAGGSQVVISPNHSAPFVLAIRACQNLLPAGAVAPLSLNPTQMHRLLTLAECVRTHGYPAFPDPSSHGQFALDLASLDPHSPQLQAAIKTCVPRATASLGSP
jgi:hypothetical protein